MARRRVSAEREGLSAGEVGRGRPLRGPGCEGRWGNCAGKQPVTWQPTLPTAAGAARDWRFIPSTGAERKCLRVGMMPWEVMAKQGGSRLPQLKARLSQRVQELQDMTVLREQGRKLFSQACEEKLAETRELLPRLREVVQEDTDALDALRAAPRSKITLAEACRAVRARKTFQLGMEKLRAEVYAQARKYDLLQCKVRQQHQTLEDLQRRLQQLKSATADDRQYQRQMQMIHQLENNIEKMVVKDCAAQKMNSLYLATRDVLREELAHLPRHLDLLSGMTETYRRELEDMELTASQAIRAAEAAKVNMVGMQSQFQAERKFRNRSLAALKVPKDRQWLKDAIGKHLKAQARDELGMDLPAWDSQDPLVDTNVEAAKAQMEQDALTEQLEKIKAAVQCSLLWDIPIRLQDQHKYSQDRDKYLQEYWEKKRALEETLKELELKQAKLKFSQAPNTTRTLEEKMLMSLQHEESKLEQMKARLMQNQKLLMQFEDGIDNLAIRLHSVSVPGQKEYVKALGLEEKLQHCEQKLRYLQQRVADLPHDGHMLTKRNKAFVEVRNLLEKATADDTQNLKVPLDEGGSSTQDLFEYNEKDRSIVLTREDIKRRGQQLIELKKKSKRKN
ncbi:coiled-coil domain-containing protein 183-like [Porphyrio hochstetteri]